MGVPGMYMKTALVPKGARAVRLSYGAGDGNRTRVISLEGWGSTIELRPQDMVGTTGFEPATSCSQSSALPNCATSRGVEQLRSKPCVSQSEGNYRGDSPPVQAQKP